jgi:hypothetical protein
LQADLYSRVFDRLTLVVGKRHAKKAIGRVPDWWGIIVAEQNGPAMSLTSEREPQPNPKPDPYLVAQLLWKEEAIAVLDRFGLGKGWRSRRVKDIHNRLAMEVPFEQLASYVRSALKRRVGWLAKVAVIAPVQCVD